jgi:DNA-binding XRE family transcriptional regulator
MTLFGLFQRVELSKQGVYNLEAEDADPRLSTIIKLADALGVSPVALIPAKGNPMPEVNRNGRPASTKSDRNKNR